MNKLVGDALVRLKTAKYDVISAEKILVDLPDRTVFSATFDDRKIIVKIDTDTNRLKCELDALAACQDIVPVPEIVYNDLTPPAILVISFVQGNNLLSTSADAFWQLAGATLADLHAMTISDLRQVSFYHDWDALNNSIHRTKGAIAQIESAMGNDGLIKAQSIIESSLGNKPPAKVFIHGDCQPAHFFIDDNKVSGVIDFGDAGIGDPIWDLAVLTMQSPEKLNTVLDGYEPSTLLRQQINETIQAYRLARLLQEIVWLLERNYGIELQLKQLRSFHL